jgi:hypothetical protein
LKASTGPLESRRIFMQKNTIGQHLLACCGFHAAMSKAHAACAKACEADSAEETFHKSAADCHLSMAEHFVEMGRNLRDEPDDVDVDTDDDSDKAAGGRFGMTAARDLDKVAPPAARGVLPNAPAPTLHARFGAAPLPGADVDPTEMIDSLKK